MGAILLACGASLSQSVQRELLSGTVGDGAASEFFGWLDRMDLPAPELVLEDPKKHFKKPKQDSEHRTYAIVAAAIALVRTKPNRQKWNKGWTMLTHVSQWSADVAVAFAREMAEIRKDAGKKAEWKVPDEARPFLKRMGTAMELVPQ